MEPETFKERKLLYVALSVLAAIVIWIFVDSSGGYVTSVTVTDIPVEFTGEETALADRGLMLLDDSQRTVDIEVKGTKAALMRMDPGRIQGLADVSRITSAGRQSISYQAVYNPASKEDADLRNSLSFSLKSYNVSLNVGELYRKSVEIRCEIRGSVAQYHIAGEVKLDPDKLELRGPQEEVERVSYAKVTLDIDNATETVAQTLEYQLRDASGREVDSANIHPVTDRIQVVLPVNVIKQLPLVVRFVEAPGSRTENLDYRVEPSTITVSGDAALLRDVNEILLEDDFDLSTVGAEEAVHHYQIVLPAGCENLSNTSRATLRIKFKDLTTRTVTVDSVIYENKPEGKVVTSLTTGVPVVLRGTSGDVEAVTEEDIHLVADLSSVSSAGGSYTVPVEARIDTDGDIGVIGNYQIKVTIEDEPDVPETETKPEDGEEP